jgi:hypothetical protein
MGRTQRERGIPTIMNNRAFIAAAVLAGTLVPLQSLAAGNAVSHPKPAPRAAVAPADEYFGRMKMSILGITNSIRDTGIREGFDPAGAAQYYGSLALTENALEDWARKYPQDGWIPRRAYDMSHDFWLMHTSDADAQADHCRTILFALFPRNRWAVIARHESAATVAPIAASGAGASAQAADAAAVH